MSSSPDYERRFWQRVVKAGGDGCWVWTGRRTGRKPAYACFRNRPAAQVAWEIEHHQPFPPGMLACHTCDNTLCVRASHIFAGTSKDNLRDMARKGRSTSKLTPDDVRAIRVAIEAGETYTAIAPRFGVDRSTIGRIARGVRFRDVR